MNVQLTKASPVVVASAHKGLEEHVSRLQRYSNFMLFFHRVNLMIPLFWHGIIASLQVFVIIAMQVLAIHVHQNVWLAKMKSLEF